MTISLVEAGTPDRTVLRVGGVVDLGTAGELTDRLADLIRRSDATADATVHATVVVDLAEVTFLDSTGLSALVSAHLAATDRDVVLVVARPTRDVGGLLRLTGLDQVLDVRADLPDPPVG